MGHPGHYFQKALNCVTYKFRSQSLPNSLEGNKPPCPSSSCNNKEPLGPKETDDHKNESMIASQLNMGSNEGWFRTWPERGNDKLASSHNFITNCNTECDVFMKCEELTGPEVKHRTCEIQPNLQSYKPISDNLCDNMSNTHHICSNLSHDETVIQDSFKKDYNVPMHCSSLWKSDLPLNCSRENCNQNVQHISSSKSMYTTFDSSDVNSCTSPVPLTELLQTIPLAYSPVTRQLHLINPTHSQQQLEDSRNHGEGKKEILHNGLKQQLLSIEEEGISAECGIVKCGEDDSLSFDNMQNTSHVGTASLSRTETSSFSSIVSSLSDSSPITDDPDDLIASLQINSLESTDCDENGVKTKRKGISGFFSRNVFVWKTSRDAQNNNCTSSNSNGGRTLGWKLFGRLASKSSQQEASENMESCQLPESPASIHSTGSGSKRYEDIVASSSALILHNRPSNLPAKSQDEDQKHRQEYQQMVEAARKKELKEAKLRKKQLQRQLKVEEQLANAARIWNNEILPKWDMMKTSRKARDLWWQGIPPSVRGKVWKLAIGNDLSVTYQVYNICLTHAQERLRTNSVVIGEAGASKSGDSVDKESSMELIQLDIARTFPHLCIFQLGGPYYDMLHCLLGAYVCYCPEVGYVQGMSFIAAVLILNLEAADAFICFANLLSRPCHMAFFCLNQTQMNAYYAAYNDFFCENLPRLYTHFKESSLSADLYLLDWLCTVFAKAMPLDVACRVWDVFLRDGEEFLFKAALGVLHLHQDILLKLDFIHGAQFLTKLPDDLAADQLFKSIEAIHMNVGKQKFEEVLAHHIDINLQKEPS